MREYARITPHFWIGKTGRKITEAGLEVRVLATYLLTNPHVNMIGLYHLPVPTMAYESGLSEAQTREALQTLSDLDFCTLDEDFDLLLVNNFVLYQVGGSFKSQDNRLKWVLREIEQYSHSPLYRKFLKLNKLQKPLPKPLKSPSGGGLSRGKRGTQSPFEGASHKEKEKEKEKCKEKEKEKSPSSSNGTMRGRGKKSSDSFFSFSQNGTSESGTTPLAGTVAEVLQTVESAAARPTRDVSWIPEFLAGQTTLAVPGAVAHDLAFWADLADVTPERLGAALGELAGWMVAREMQPPLSPVVCRQMLTRWFSQGGDNGTRH